MTSFNDHQPPHTSESLLQQLEETGQRARLIQELRIKLIECGWRDEMMELSKEIIRWKGGISEITLEELALELLKRGKSEVPDELKTSIMDQLKAIAADKPFSE
mmetsp:Transcript_7691/g.11273  ORF Transcript_7691/g.11273 Transcript_7691/m.11273 type:complete len:104 (+) Transcript_7691:110-421(+)|eukprot:CAMPEP_0197249520 /NCGR_PEP_ID=MMETSP1429-20130617/47859_1 /TAXON_ID=49237 /ORGANISM="Chaetoceros  sp., Strain UNC1202" /LENGTH=103 /DNA_ID=CAMNT_0042711077 /DNA_START=100 /DNA_END=411 /DNA_ORIENTATION=-